MPRITDLPPLPPRRPDSHKGDYGRVVVIGGSTGMIGAPCLCGRAALRSGAGLVTVAVPAGIYPTVAAKLTNCMTFPLPERDGGIALAGIPEAAEALAFLRAADVIAIGPGLGRKPGTLESILHLLTTLECPLVIDADALFAVAGDPGVCAARRAPHILTPHLGEMSRLINLRPDDIQKDRESCAAEAAKKFKAVVVLKGNQTVIADAARIYVNTTGNPGMATGGTGDVLAGIIAGLLAQQMQPFAAAQLGAYLHGLAGDLATRKVGQVSLIATDVLRHIPKAFLKFADRS